MHASANENKSNENVGGEVGAFPVTPLDMNAALVSIDSMIYQHVRAVAAREMLDDAAVQSIAQEVRLSLWKKSIPKFDPGRGNKFSTFAHICIRNALRSILRSYRHRRLQEAERTPQESEHTFYGLPSREASLDYKIEQLSEAIIANPAKFGLTRKQVRIFYAVVDAEPGTKLKDIATAMGYSGSVALADMLRRIRNRITAISIEDWSPDTSITTSPQPRPRQENGMHRAASCAAVNIAVEDRLRRGETTQEITTALGISSSRVYRIHHRMRIRENRVSLRKPERLAVEERLRRGERSPQIAAAMGIPLSRVHGMKRRMKKRELIKATRGTV